MSHNTLLVFELTILVLAIFLGFEVISKVPVVLHTPLMSGTNAIHGIVVIGGILVLGFAHGPVETWLGFGAAGVRRGGVGRHDPRRGLRGPRPHARHVQGEAAPQAMSPAALSPWH